MIARSLHTRPQVVFDASNTEHRKLAANFIKNRSWSGCPVQFIVHDPSMDLSNVIQRQLVQYYIEQEFKTTGV